MDSDEGAQQAAAKLSEALEYVERARGHLYSFHQLTGHADLLLNDVLEGLESADRNDLIELVRTQLYGRDVLFGRWTFEVVDEFDSDFYPAWQSVELRLREELAAGRKHTYEAQLKKERQARGVKGPGGAESD